LHPLGRGGRGVHAEMLQTLGCHLAVVLSYCYQKVLRMSARSYPPYADHRVLLEVGLLISRRNCNVCCLTYLNSCQLMLHIALKGETPS